MWNAGEPRGHAERDEPGRIDEKPADDLRRCCHVRFAREPPRRIPGQVVRDRKHDQRGNRERAEHDRCKRLADGETRRV